MIKVVSFKICPFVQRVTALLAAKNIPFEVEYISLKNKPQWFLQVSPNGQVPLLVTDNGSALFESDAIIEYIEEAYPALESNVSFEQKALDRAWSYLATKHYLTQCSVMRSKDQTTFSERNDKLMSAFAKIEQQLTGTGFFKGNHMSLVDIAWLPLLHRAHIIETHTGYDFFNKLPNVKAWQQRIVNSAITIESVADDFESAFREFYLSNTTWLGNGFTDCTTVGAPCQTSSCC
ncbi:glutathione S-transferase family protein [Thalassotalea sp. HSM 43]|uniref:glutathione S-transferase family protein n=1 Tax=Thalassotalea sp. HSM 43 TaxID=2552945 RepID=UPI001081FB3D|nr:glutathione S-transferase family protein [Thalassotalea sp. HSM 43]QBY05862.1 glutathione S-transferase family protein [Thalassotalea sp. HSM 43]